MTLTLDGETDVTTGAQDPGATWATGTLKRHSQARPATVVLLSEARTGRRIVSAARELLAVADYASVDFTAVAQAGGVRPEDVSRRFASRMELTLAALELPPALPAARRSRLSGAETVLRFLRFWETGANAGILTNVLRAGMHDGRSRREVEDVLGEVLFVPLATGLGTTDAGPRARLVSSALVGLAVTRFILCEEPLASADHCTLAAWMGPSIDCYLRGALGA
jgi:hypothetical protein